jgi:hypothetical protein
MREGATAIAFGSVRSTALLVTILAALVARAGVAAEGGSGMYLLGYSGPQAGYQPPPGWYLKTDAFYYDASTSGQLPFANRITADVDARVFGAIFTPTWISEYELLGANLGFGMAIPILRLDLEVGVASERVGRLSDRLLTAEQRFADLSARLAGASSSLLGVSRQLATASDQLAFASDRLARFFPNASARAEEFSVRASRLSAGAADLAERARRGSVVLAEAADAAGELSDLTQNFAFAGLSDHDANIGDLALTPLMGWHEGDFHFMVAPSVLAPTGHYDPDDIANVGKNHWAIDLSVGGTWLTTKTGQEVSIFAGYTINFENHSTDYDSGDELHVELALIQHLPWGLSIGLVGYYYDQVTDDRGDATVFLGGFQGRVFGGGPMLGWMFKLGERQAGISGRWYHESGARNRLEGDIGFVTITLVL